MKLKSHGYHTLYIDKIVRETRETVFLSVSNANQKIKRRVSQYCLLLKIDWLSTRVTTAPSSAQRQLFRSLLRHLNALFIPEPYSKPYFSDGFREFRTRNPGRNAILVPRLHNHPASRSVRTPQRAMDVPSVGSRCQQVPGKQFYTTPNIKFLIFSSGGL